MAGSHQRRLLIRADASEKIGSGHVMRMIALGQAWRRRGGAVMLAAQSLPPGLQQRLVIEGLAVSRLSETSTTVESIRETIDVADSWSADCIVLDGYAFDFDSHSLLRHPERPLLVVDDHQHLPEYNCDLILNQNFGAAATDYQSRVGNAEVLAGSQFAMLRNEFLTTEKFQRNLSGARRLLITLGGSDPENITASVLQALPAVADLNFEVRVLVGGSNPNFQKLKEFAGALPDVSIIQDTAEMCSQYQWAELAVAAGGSTNWEMSLLGLPRIVIVLADNQQPVASALEQAGVIIHLGDHQSLTTDRIAAALRRLATDQALRQQQADRSRELVDGRGADRVAEALTRWCLQIENKYFGDEDLLLRPAVAADSEMLLEWRNDELTRSSSRQQDFVSTENHQRWFAETLATHRRRLYIAATRERPVGTVRLDFDQEVELSWTVAPTARGQGRGRAMVQRVVDHANCDLAARVRHENIASQKIAIAAGFELAADDGEMFFYQRKWDRTPGNQ